MIMEIMDMMIMDMMIMNMMRRRKQQELERRA